MYSLHRFSVHSLLSTARSSLGTVVRSGNTSLRCKPCLSLKRTRNALDVIRTGELTNFPKLQTGKIEWSNFGVLSIESKVRIFESRKVSLWESKG